MALALGDALLVAAFFSPWLILSTSFEGFPPRQAFSPWLLLLQGDGNIPLIMAIVFGIPTLGLIAGTITLLFARSHWARLLLERFCLTVGAVYVGLGSLVLALLPTALAFDFPYYRTDPDWGLGVALAGVVGITLGLVAFAPRRTPEESANAPGPV